jgi:hypothetical protein
LRGSPSTRWIVLNKRWIWLDRFDAFLWAAFVVALWLGSAGRG